MCSEQMAPKEEAFTVGPITVATVLTFRVKTKSFLTLLHLEQPKLYGLTEYNRIKYFLTLC